MFSLSSHEEGCSPANPCRHCVVETFLREHLAPEQFQELLDTMYPPPPPPPALDTQLDELPGYRFLGLKVQRLLQEVNIITIQDLIPHTKASLNRLIPGIKYYNYSFDRMLRGTGYELGTKL